MNILKFIVIVDTQSTEDQICNSREQKKAPVKVFAICLENWAHENSVYLVKKKNKF